MTLTNLRGASGLVMFVAILLPAWPLIALYYLGHWTERLAEAAIDWVGNTGYGHWVERTGRRLEDWADGNLG